MGNPACCLFASNRDAGAGCLKLTAVRVHLAGTSRRLGGYSISGRTTLRVSRKLAIKEKARKSGGSARNMPTTLVVGSKQASRQQRDQRFAHLLSVCREQRSQCSQEFGCCYKIVGLLLVTRSMHCKLKFGELRFRRIGASA
jgi:hypothetical protein